MLVFLPPLQHRILSPHRILSDVYRESIAGGKAAVDGIRAINFGFLELNISPPPHIIIL
jgi:hypothetical protein